MTAILEPTPPLSSVDEADSSKLNTTRVTIMTVSNRTYHGNAALEHFMAELRDQFSAPLDPNKLLHVSRSLQETYKHNVARPGPSMLPSFIYRLPTGKETGSYLSVDVGGSTFRCGIIQLNGEGEPKILIIKSFKITNDIKQLRGRKFFNWMADRISDTLDLAPDPDIRHQDMQMGLAWSFPIAQTSLSSGRLQNMGKNFRACEELLDEDLSEVFATALQSRGLGNIRMAALLNDADAVLLSHAYSDPESRFGLVHGTGFNAAVELPLSCLCPDKIKGRPQEWLDRARNVLVNTELSMYGGDGILELNPYDQILDKEHLRPGFQPFEMLVGGLYLGELLRLVLVRMISDGLIFGGVTPEGLLTPYSLEASTMSAFETDTSPTVSMASHAFLSAHPLPPNSSILTSDWHLVKEISHLISQRATAYVAAGLHSLWQFRLSCKREAASGSATPEILALDSSNEVHIAFVGSVMEKYPLFRERAEAFMAQLIETDAASQHSSLPASLTSNLTSRPLPKISLKICVESSIIGAAVAAACAAAEQTRLSISASNNTESTKVGASSVDAQSRETTAHPPASAGPLPQKLDVTEQDEESADTTETERSSKGKVEMSKRKQKILGSRMIWRFWEWVRSLFA